MCHDTSVSFESSKEGQGTIRLEKPICTLILKEQSVWKYCPAKHKGWMSKAKIGLRDGHSLMLVFRGLSELHPSC